MFSCVFASSIFASNGNEKVDVANPVVSMLLKFKRDGPRMSRLFLNHVIVVIGDADLMSVSIIFEEYR